MDFVLVLGYVFFGAVWTAFRNMITRKRSGFAGIVTPMDTIVNFLLWPLCVPLWGFAKVLLKRDTLINYE